MQPKLLIAEPAAAGRDKRLATAVVAERRAAAAGQQLLLLTAAGIEAAPLLVGAASLDSLAQSQLLAARRGAREDLESAPQCEF